MKIEKVLVTGGAGFIGSHTVDLLLAQGKQVLVLDNLSTGKMLNLNMQHPNLEFVEGDILEYPLMVTLLKDCDAVLHLAAIPSVPKSVDMPVYTFQVNTQGTLHLLEAIRQSKRNIRFVFASSSATYGDTPLLPCEEKNAGTSPPLSPYALQKWQSEEYTRLFSMLFNTNYLCLRYFNVYGPRQDPSSPYSGVISLFLKAYANDREFTIFGDGLQTRDFIHATDVARANLMALESDYKGVVNICTGEKQTLLKLVEYIEAAGDRKAKYAFADPRPGDIKHSYGTNELAKQNLNFTSKVHLKDGIKQLLKDKTVIEG